MFLSYYDTYTEVLGAAVLAQIKGIFWRNPPDTIWYCPVELAKPISRKLNKFLKEYQDISAFLWTQDLTEPQLLGILDEREVLVLHRKNKNSQSIFKIIESEEFTTKKWRVLYGIDSEQYYTDFFDSYSSALENGAMEFISALYKKNENGELYYRLR